MSKFVIKIYSTSLIEIVYGSFWLRHVTKFSIVCCRVPKFESGNAPGLNTLLDTSLFYLLGFFSIADIDSI